MLPLTQVQDSKSERPAEVSDTLKVFEELEVSFFYDFSIQFTCMAFQSTDKLWWVIVDYYKSK